MDFDVKYIEDFFEEYDAIEFIEKQKELKEMLLNTYETVLKKKEKEYINTVKLYNILDDFDKKALFEEIEDVKDPKIMLNIILERTKEIRILSKELYCINHKKWNHEFFVDTIKDWKKYPPKRGEILDCWYFEEDSE